MAIKLIGIVPSILVSLIARTSMSLVLIMILSSSMCSGRLAMFRPAILKPLNLGEYRVFDV